MVAVPGSDASEHYVSPRFIGRRAERSTFSQAIARSRAGEGTVILIEGEAGIGKSRLLDEGLREARASGYQVMVGGCVRMREDAAPLAPIAEALRDLAAQTPPAELARLLGPAREVLSGLLPGLWEPTSQESHSGLAPTLSQQRLHEHLVDLLARLARAKPLVLVIEDIHWADSITLELLTLAVRRLRAAAFTLVATYRTDESDAGSRLGAFLADLERLARPTHIRLRRFNRGEVTEHVAAIRGPLHAQPEVVEAVLARSEGNPFYTEELLAAPANDARIPENLDEILRARLSALSDAARQIVGAAAVRSGESTEDELAAVTGSEGAELARALHELLDRNILDRRLVGGREALAFRHALLKSAAYDQLLSSERRALHLGYADLLAGRPGNREDPFACAELAAHLEAAGDYGRALEAALQAGIAAEAAYQSDLAREEYERALRQFDRVPEGDLGESIDRVDVLERAARAAAAIGSASSIDHIHEALTLLDPAEDPVRAGLLYERLGRYEWYRADSEGALAHYREAVRLIPSAPPSAARARAVAGLAQLYTNLGRFEESARLSKEALANARAVDDRAIEAHVKDTMGITMAYLGDVERGLEMLWEANTLAAQEGNVEEVARTYNNLVDVLVTTGRFQEGADLGREAHGYCVQHGLEASYGAGQLIYATWALQVMGLWDEALDVLGQARSLHMDTADEILSLAMGTIIEAYRGEVGLAEAYMQLARPAMGAVIETQLILPFTEAEAELALATNRPADALAAVLSGIARSEALLGGNIERYGPIYARGMRAAADVLALSAEAGELAGARAAATKLMSVVNKLQGQIKASDEGHLRLARAYIALCQAELSRIDGGSRPEAWALAATRLAEIGRRHWTAYAQYRQAEAEFQLHGKTQLVDDLLNEAVAVAVELRAEPLRAAFDQLARKARIKLGTSASVNLGDHDAQYGLTAREKEVLRLVAAGKTNREIGDELFISGKTASVHVSNVLAKLGASRRSEAAALAERIGLGPEEAA